MDEEEDPLANFSIADVSSDEADDSKQARRTGQSEEAWRAIQRGYKTKVENGDIYKKVKLPLEPGASKMDIQELLHAVEELYFSRRYQDAVQLAGDALSGSNGLDRDSRQLLATYQERCQKKLTPLA
ncbi:hypothetical protein FALBO_5176 [Fusarium albosuccineum]|uniref:Uncharacterized protein n=1 Tax=Fusarium albosuccineum TaxID=1237068 RepID=A0A8H4PKH9_9HYPO|nr:hypothetical protein FALBO_5176 [Fusarium albosuccineum]